MPTPFHGELRDLGCYKDVQRCPVSHADEGSPETPQAPLLHPLTTLLPRAEEQGVPRPEREVLMALSEMQAVF